mmetsp:Transcript_29480/g.68386  ORF Transcript_29480/g.68386 Transcript_29480/m.68386 type:complete len:90 (-) Transcript_29480:709-978(-)
MRSVWLGAVRGHARARAGARAERVDSGARPERKNGRGGEPGSAGSAAQTHLVLSRPNGLRASFLAFVAFLTKPLLTMPELTRIWKMSSL